MSQTLRDLTGLRNRSGDVGVEVELEWDGDALPRGIQGTYSATPDGSRAWVGHQDNSLRNGYEYTLDAPITIDQLDWALNRLFTDVPRPLRWSQRTSIHCHFNMLNKDIVKIYNNILGFWVLEDLILEQCAPHRRGNLFALPWKLADNQVTTLVEDYNKRRTPFATFHTDRYKYASMNLCNLTRFGTLEFRALEGTDDKNKIMMFFQGIHELFGNLEKFKNPAELFDWFYKTKNADEVIDRLLPNKLGEKIKTVKSYQDKMQESITELSYAAYLDWTKYEKASTGEGEIEFMRNNLGDRAEGAFAAPPLVNAAAQEPPIRRPVRFAQVR